MARLLGGLAQKLKQPSVVGEILAGVLLGPSLLAGAFPAVGEWILPRNEVQGFLLEAVALIGVMFLLIVTGLETDLALIRRKARTAIGVAIGGLVLPFATGIAPIVHADSQDHVRPDKLYIHSKSEEDS